MHSEAVAVRGSSRLETLIAPISSDLQPLGQSNSRHLVTHGE
jgi:hypothetical protein